MKLNYDLFRKLLLIIEDETVPNHLSVSTNFKHPDLDGYSLLEITYHLKKLKEADLIISTTYIDGEISVTDLTMKGHEFIARIRSESIWSKTKHIAEDIGIKSIDSLFAVSSSVLSNLIGNLFL